MGSTAVSGLSADFEVVVLGGGPAGCATALALARLGVSRVLVAESGAYETNRVGESIPPDTRLLLQELGLWEEFEREEHDVCLGSCSSWGDDELGYNDFLFNPYGNGWHLDRRRFDSFLARKAVECGVELRTNTRFSGCEHAGGHGFQLRLKADDEHAYTVRARFVVDATGERARFARQLGARQRFLDRLVYVSGFFELPADSRFSKLTMLEAVECGWWYAAKLPDGRLTAAVASEPEFVKQAALHKPENWLDCLKQSSHLSRELAACRFIKGSLSVCAVPSFLLDKAAGNGWLAVGDAASAYDPISSQGIHKALSDGLQAANVIAAFLEGDAGKLGAYQSSIANRFDNYLENRNFFYGLEKRWPASLFWSRRQERTTL